MGSILRKSSNIGLILWNMGCYSGVVENNTAIQPCSEQQNLPNISLKT